MSQIIKVLPGIREEQRLALPTGATIPAAHLVDADGATLGTSSNPLHVHGSTGGGGGGGLTDAELRASPVPVTDAQGGTRYYDWVQNKRVAVSATSTVADTLPPLYASREMMAHASVRCFVRFGGSNVGAASAGGQQLIVEPGERFHFRVNVGDTHYRVIRDTADGHLSLTAVIA